MINMINKLINFYYRLMGYDVTYRYMPTKELLKHAQFVDNLPQGTDLNHTGISPPTVGEIATWVPYRTKEFKSKLASIKEAEAKAPRHKVKPKWWEEADYKSKIRQAAVDAVKEVSSNDTIH